MSETDGNGKKLNEFVNGAIARFIATFVMPAMGSFSLVLIGYILYNFQDHQTKLESRMQTQMQRFWKSEADQVKSQNDLSTTLKLLAETVNYNRQRGDERSQRLEGAINDLKASIDRRANDKGG